MGNLCITLLLDWSLDSLSDDEWENLLKTDEGLANEKININKADQLYARARVFGGGYLLLSLGLGCIAATITWLANPSIDSVRETIFMKVAALSVFGFVSIKMLTKRLMSAFIPAIVIIVFVLIAVVGTPLSKAIGLGP